MGQRGPQRTPTAVLALRGSRRADEPWAGRQDEVSPAATTDGLKFRFKRHRARNEIYSDLLARLEPLGFLGDPDSELLHQLADAICEYEDAQAHIVTDGAVVTGSNGSPVVSPWVRILNTRRADIMRLGALFGLSPAARAGLTAGKPAANDPRSRYLGKIK